MQTDVLLGRADDLLHSGRPGRAASILTPMVGEQPDNVEAWLLLTRAHLALRRPGPALDAARAALRLDPRGLEPLYWVSVAYSAMGRHDLAISAAVTAESEDPGNPRLMERHGRALLAAGRIAEAEHVAGIAAELAGYDADVHVAHGVALFAAGRPMSAREAYARALRIDPAHARAQGELRRLAAAERRIVDAASLVKVTDEFAESLRVPAGGPRPVPPGRSVLAHLSAVVFAVCLLTSLVLTVLDRFTPSGVPLPLTFAMLCAAGSSACITVLLRPI